MKPNFVILFPVAQNVHLIKDVGQIANALAAKGNYNSTLVCYNNSPNYNNQQTEARHLKIHFLKPKGQFLFMEKAVLNYLKENAQKIDVLQLFHLTKESIYYGLHYLKYNKKGKIYLKMDVYNEMLEQGITYSKKPLFQWFHNLKERQFLKKITVITAENPLSLALLKKSYPIITDKAILLTNGINVAYVAENFPERLKFHQKQNIILSVGRIGVEEKNYKMLVDAFCECDYSDWKLVLVGPIENKFDEYVSKKIVANPALKHKIELVGNVEDRVSLYEYYNQSKLFCLTSPFESFGIAFTEAMYFGNYVIGTSGHSSFDFITNEEQLGIKVPIDDVSILIKVFNERILDNSKLAANASIANKQVVDKFNWSKIVEPLLDRLK